MEAKCISIGKIGESNCINEDTALARGYMIAVSDGAGGGGLFADKWSRHLVCHLPDRPITTADALDDWIGRIWESFYNNCESEAKQLGGMLLNKFYDEGSFATLVAVWKTSANTCQWMSFGDSVAFHYNRATKRLEHSFGKLGDFDEPPYLINCKDELKKDGFRTGTFHTDKDSVVFAASDALSHYIMMMYEVSRQKTFAEEIGEAASHHTKNENYIKAALALSKFNFEKDVLNNMLRSLKSREKFTQHLQRIIRSGLLAHDDYTLSILM